MLIFDTAGLPVSDTIPPIKFTTNHRRFFDLLSTGWLEPKRDDLPLLFGIEHPVADAAEVATDGEIPLTITLDPAKLPNVPVATLNQDGSWDETMFDDVTDGEDEAILWPGAIPAFAIDGVDTPTRENLEQLTLLCRRRTENLTLGDIPFTVGFENKPCPSIFPPDHIKLERSVNVPKDNDRIAGAFAIASWLAPDADLMDEYIGKAPWLKYRIYTRGEHNPSDFNECIWLAARDNFIQHDRSKQTNIVELAGKIADTTKTLADGKFADQADSWLGQTRDVIIRTIAVKAKKPPSEIAGNGVLVALLCGDARRFQSWRMSSIGKPAVMTAGLLVGLRHGFSNLPQNMRGNRKNRDAIQATTFCEIGRSYNWPVSHLKDISVPVPQYPMESMAVDRGL